eukprot:4589018-Pleurochrysis_carterae.AAC.8
MVQAGAGADYLAHHLRDSRYLRNDSELQVQDVRATAGGGCDSGKAPVHNAPSGPHNLACVGAKSHEVQRTCLAHALDDAGDCFRVLVVIAAKLFGALKEYTLYRANRDEHKND